MKQGKTHTPAKKLNGSGSGVVKRDSAVGKGVSRSGTKVIDKTQNGHLSRGKGSFKSYC